MKVTVRKFSGEDTASLVSLFHETVHSINSKDYPQEQLDAWAPALPDLKKWRARFKTSKTLVAEFEGKIVGFGNLENELSTVDMLYVHKDHQRQGIATSLLKKLEKKLRESDTKTATAEVSITARPFFERSGYHLVRENRKMLNGKEFLNFIMEKELTLKESIDMKDDKVKKKQAFRWGDLFINKVFDLLIVILGVSIAFQLNNLKLESDQQSLEKFYLESMLTDLDKDVSECNENLENLRSDHKLVAGYLRKLQQPEPTADSLGIVIVETIWFDTFNGNQDTYSTLLASNGFSALGDRAIRSQITEYYKQYQSVERFDKVYTDILFQFYTYFSPYCDFSTRQIIDASVVEKVQTRNNLLMALGQLNDSIESYTEMIAKATALKARIESTIQK